MLLVREHFSRYNNCALEKLRIKNSKICKLTLFSNTTRAFVNHIEAEKPAAPGFPPRPLVPNQVVPY